MSNFAEIFLNIRSFIEHTLLPQQCVLCAANAGQSAFCSGCHADLPWLPALRCPVCALPTPDGRTCGLCLSQPPAFAATFCHLAYAFPLDALIQQYKYSRRLALVGALSGLLRDTCQRQQQLDLVIPAPLHPQRLQQRGFNQVVELLRPWVAKDKLALNAVSNIRANPHQADLPWKQRATNVKGCYRCEVDLSGKRVALVDDVMTSGATLRELAKVARRAGASHVECWVLARTLPR